MTPGTLSTVLQWLTNAGYTEDLAVAGNGLRATPSGRRFAPAELATAAAAVFTDHAHGEAAVLELLEFGPGSEHLGVAIRADTSVVFEHDEEAELARDVEAGMATGVPTSFLAGMALAALAVPGIGVPGFGVLGTAGLIAVCSHGQPDTVRAVMQRHDGRLLTHGPVLH
jgi:hypothetical protein